MAPSLAGRLRLSATGALPVDEVWERYTRPVWWPHWAPHIRHVEYADAVVRAGTGRAGSPSTTASTLHLVVPATPEAARHGS